MIWHVLPFNEDPALPAPCQKQTLENPAGQRASSPSSLLSFLSLSGSLEPDDFASIPKSGLFSCPQQ